MSDRLRDLIAARIRSRGPVTVAEYMELALYHPAHGYYARVPRRSGRAGDFFTSVDVGPLFGELLARQFAEMWRILSSADRPIARSPDRAITGFDLVEAAAGDGRLARDVLDAAAVDATFYDAIRLRLVERSDAARRCQAETLGAHAGKLVGSSDSLPDDIHGVIYANELLDALPAHVVQMSAQGLREVHVTLGADGRLVEELSEPTTPALVEYLKRAGACLRPGWRAEINLAALEWMRAAARRLRRGFLLIVDYGHPASELYSAAHAAGTLTSVRRHAADTHTTEWLSDPGERDLTSHVDFTSIQGAAREEGLDTIAFVDQTYFVLGLSLAGLKACAVTGAGPADLKRRLALKTLMLPGGLGTTHKVLVLGRNVGRPALSGAAGGRLT